MLWNVVYEFFVKYIFGGFVVTGGNLTEFNAFFGQAFFSNTNGPINTSRVLGFSCTDLNGNSFNVSLGNYLSLIATIISMVVLVVLCCMFIKKIYNMVAHVIG